ncbi:right-handed parallel beta-helix repeat-containing protein [Streptomyces sp. NPDC058045]|uniref:right-handed parallel beta-helix repeat-containing protein n=1 Tax=Streptomyces sp. NPDC058045 TaxID=3346311 RepID=UPI0036E5453D
MALYTFGGVPEDVLTDTAGNTIPDYPVLVRTAGTGAVVSALFEADGDPISTLRSNPADSDTPGAVRTFRTADVPEIEIEYTGPSGQPVRWYRAARELPAGAHQAATQALNQLATRLDTATTEPQTVAGPVTFEQPITAPNLAASDLAGAGLFVVNGAAGDGTTDDRAPIQAALDAARDAGGGTVIIPGGHTYAVSYFLMASDNTVISAYGATIKATGNTGLLRNFLSSETFTGYDGHSNIQVLGGIWDGNAADGNEGTVTANTDVLNFIHCRNITVRDAVIRNTSSAHALEFNSTNGGTAENCRFEGYRDNSGTSARQFSEAVQLDLAVSGSSSIGAFDNTASRNIRIDGCYFGPSARLGAFGRAVGSHTVRKDVYYDNVQITDCRIDGALQDGIRGYGWRNTVITGNIITGTGMSGIKLTVPDPAVAGYTLTPRSVTIADNIIDSNASEAGVRIEGAGAALISDAVVQGNSITNSGSVGVHLESAPRATVTGNTVRATAGTGILVQHSDDATVTGNTLRATGSNAINFTGSTAGTASGNTVDTTGSNFGVFAGPDGATPAVNSTGLLITCNNISAAASYGIRLSTAATGCTITGNKIRKGAGTTTGGISLAATATGAAIAGNDLTGNGWTAATALSLSTAAPRLDWAGGITSPGHNLVG